MPTPQRLDAGFFRLESGGEPVREWLKNLPKDERKAIGEDIAYVQFKWPIGKPRVDHLRGAVWEVRTSLANRIARTTLRGRGTADSAASWVHQEDPADTECRYQVGGETLQGVATWRSVTPSLVPGWMT